jgi:hypothetical protein
MFDQSDYTYTVHVKGCVMGLAKVEVTDSEKEVDFPDPKAMAMAILGTFFLVVGSMCAHYYHGCV